MKALKGLFNLPQLGLWNDASSGENQVSNNGLLSPTSGREFRHPQAEREILLGDALVAYAVQRASRRTIGMVVSMDGLIVRAPKWVAWRDIETALKAKERWICRKLDEQRDRASHVAAARIDWREGASVPFMGDAVVIVLDPGARSHVLKPGLIDQTGLPGVAQQTLHLAIAQHASADEVRDAFMAWMRSQARAHFAARVTHYAERLRVNVSRVSLSSARTRWGSASADGSIRLHWKLMHFSPDVIDYVVAHELAHLHEMNHSPRFWAVVRSVMPNFEQARHHLRQVVLPE